MKVNLIKEVEVTGREFYWVKSNEGSICRCFTSEKDASDFFDSIKTLKPSTAILKEKEVSDANNG
jgi:hypothetical protein